MCLLVSDPNISHRIHLSNFQTEDVIFSKKKKNKKDKYQTILSSKKCKDIYHLLQKTFSPSYGGRWGYYQASYSWHTFLDQFRSRKSNQQTSLNARYERFRFYSCIRSHKSHSIVKEKKLIDTWMEHDIFASRGKVKLFLSFLQQVRNFTNKSQCLGYTFRAPGGQEEYVPSWLHNWWGKGLQKKPQTNPSSDLGLRRTDFRYWLWNRHLLSGNPLFISAKQGSSASQWSMINSILLEGRACIHIWKGTQGHSGVA